MKSTTFGLTQDRLLRLLHIGSESQGTPTPPVAEPDKRTLIEKWLSDALPDGSRAGTMGRAVKDVLFAPDTDLVVIKSIKDHYKERVAAARTKAESDAATALYYAAIGAGLVCYDRRLSSYSYQDLARSFAVLVQKEWIGKDLCDLFEKARQVCDKKVAAR